MSFNKKTTTPALSLKQSGNFGKLPGDAIVGMDRRDLPPSLRRKGVANTSSGRQVPSYMQGTQTSDRKDLGMNVKRLTKPAQTKAEDGIHELKGYGAPTKLPSLYENSTQQKQVASVTQPGQISNASPQNGYAPLQIGKSREVTAKELTQINKSCRYVRRKGSLIDPPAFYYKRWRGTSIEDGDNDIEQKCIKFALLDN